VSSGNLIPVGSSVGKPPLASVVIPAYNAASYIAATLDGVMQQTLPNFEVLVVNDGSPDTSDFEQALAPYFSRIRYIAKENGGPSSARNAGIQAARGKYVAFLDSDDFWLPHHLEKQVGTLEANQQFQMVYANGIHLRGNNPLGVLFDSMPQAFPVDLDCLLHERSTVITSSAVVTRDALLKAGLFDEQLRRCEDYDLWLRLVQSGATLTFNYDIQIGHRQSNGLAKDWELMRHALIKVYEKHLSLGKLNSDQQQFVRNKIKDIASAIDFRHAKQALLAGDFPKAIASVRNVQASDPDWKLGVLCIGLKGFPQALRAMYRAHLWRIQRRSRERSARALKKAGWKGFGEDSKVLTDPTLM
jgi:glycosyltransferase involved in cell wall biosynthesis